ncbi:hypothetical protein I4U23_020007 [Adineta vaga]|nr:hypothetical protein I4U23_020007 [Adineta vaga]
MLIKRCIIYFFGIICTLMITIVLLNISVSIINQLVENKNHNWFDFTRLRPIFNHSVNTATPRLCVITRIYGPQVQYLPIFALSLYQSGLENDRIFVINTDNRTDIQLLNQTIRFINELVARSNYVTFLNFNVHSVANDYGYQLTDRVLKYIYDNSIPYASACQYIMFTNGDNYYSRYFGSKIIPHMKAGYDIIAWGFVSHHSWPEFQEITVNKHRNIPQIFDDGSNKCINVRINTSRADLGTVTYRLTFLKRHKLYFRTSDGTYNFKSDGLFIQRAAKLTNLSVLLRQTLFMHQ